MNGSDEVMEALKRTEQSLIMAEVEHDYYFSEWPSCTCGHVYRAAVGEKAYVDAEVRNVRSTDGLYEQVMEAIEAVVGNQAREYGNVDRLAADADDYLSILVSNETIVRRDAVSRYSAAGVLTEGSDELARRAALALVRDAIAYRERSDDEHRERVAEGGTER